MKENKTLKGFAMNKCILFLFIFSYFLCVNPGNNRASAQTTEIEQLLLNVEKLAQLKNILKDMKQGYETVSRGYNTVKNITEGNFNLHDTFLEGLMLVNPEIKKYARIADIIRNQKEIASSYRSAFSRFKSSGYLSREEILYLDKVYKQLLSQSLESLDELITILTSSKLRMNDGERLAAIDRIHADMENKRSFISDFNNQTRQFLILRGKKFHEINALKQLYK